MDINLESNYENNSPENSLNYPRPKPRAMPRFGITDDIVISGIAGRFPESDNMDEFADNLFKNIDMVTYDDRRWPTDLHNGIVSRAGKLKELDKFDASFFSLLTVFADSIDAQSRLMLETTYEAICDAGVNPQTMRGTKTGVYVGINTNSCSDGIPQDDFQDCLKMEAMLHMYGTEKALYANRISFCLDFHGPSYLLDTSCSSSLVAFVNALNDLRNGKCDQAVVATAVLNLAPFSNLILDAGNMQSADGKCKVWDKKADGYVRAETVGSIFLQKKSDAKRVYATVLNAKTNTDGFKSFGFFCPFWVRQRDLMIETYQEAGVNPNDVKFLETHGTGTPVGDPQEVMAIADAFCSEHRDEPLLIGALKSNMGHSEGASGVCTIAKAIIAFENQCIPANLHFEEPNPELTAIVNKTLVPVVKNTPFNHNIIGVNSFGIGGVNAHVLLKANNKELNEEMNKIADIIPRLVNVCGRTEESVIYIFDFIENNTNKVNREFLALLTDVMKSITVKGSSNFPYRGYMIIKEKLNEDNSINYDYSRTITTANKKQSVWLAFTGMGSQWTAMAKTLMPIKVFESSIKRSANVLKPYNIDLMHILLSDDQNLLNERITNPFVAITSMQIALYDIISLLNLKIDGIIGHSFGEIACAYADGCLTQEQAVLCSYWRGKVVENAIQSDLLPKGMLAAVSLSWQEIKKRCPDGIVPVCHNSSDSVTISGLYDKMLQFMEELKSEKIFVRPVAGGNFPYHTSFMNIVAPQLLDALKSIIHKPKQRSSKWISTSVPPEEWHQEKTRHASGEYFTNNLVSPVYFKEAMDKIKKDSIVIEVAPHSLFESILSRGFSNLIYSSLMKRTESDNLNYLLSSIGTLYTYGLNPDIENLYPRIEWPVSRGTQSISSLIKWDHERINEVKKFPEYFNFSTASDFRMKISLNDPDWCFLKDQTIDGRVLFPLSGYLWMVWRRMAALRGQQWIKIAIAMENVRFTRSTFLTETNPIKFTVRILEGTGDFTVTEDSSIVCTGKVYVPCDGIHNDVKTVVSEEKEIIDEDCDILLSKDIYKELRIRGYDYGPNFQGLVEASGNGMRGKVKWTGHVISFVDSLLHLQLMAQPIRALFVPIGVQSFRIDPNILFQSLQTVITKKTDVEVEHAVVDNHEENKLFYFEESETELKDFDSLEEEDKVSKITVIFDASMESIITRGVEIRGLILAKEQKSVAEKDLKLNKYVFIANNEESAIDEEFKDEIIEYIEVCCSLIEQLSKVTDKINKPNLNGYEFTDELTVKKCLDSTKDNHKILNLLKKTIDENNNITEEVIKTEINIDFDLLKTVSTRERYIRPLLELIMENCFDRKSFKVLEFDPKNTILAANIISFIQKSCGIEEFIGLEYCVALQSPSDLSEDFKSLGVKIIECNIAEQRILNDLSFNLIVYRPNLDMSNYFSIEDQIKVLNNSVKDNGFILLLTRNVLTPPEISINDLFNINSDIEILSIKELEVFIETAKKYNLKSVAQKSDSLTSKLILLRKLNSDTKQVEIINITNGKYEQWVNVLKEKIEENRNANNKKYLWLVANDTPINGIIGLVNCLRLETGGEFIRCIFDYNNKLPLPVDFTQSPYNEVIKMDLTTNVYKDGEWGTYRYLSLSEERETIMTEHAYLNFETRGDMSSLKWFDARHKYFPSLTLNERTEHNVLCNVFYSSLNFRDVAIITGIIDLSTDMTLSDCIIGLEFAGRRADNGKRVMGIVECKGIATSILTFRDYLWSIPDKWTLEDAATVPVVYLTAYYALIMRGGLQCGESVLIHSGAGGVGQAAINICQSLNCEIFVTVGNQEKQEFIKNTFNIDDTHICYSHDTSFEKQIMTVTKGKGVDVVLNSLAEDKLQASVRCLAKNGRFLEFGKYDMQTNRYANSLDVLKNTSFHGVAIDFIFNERIKSKKYRIFMKQITKLINDGIENNVVKPIVRTVFDMNECEQAFRYMTTGKHIGKVLIKIRDEESEKIVVNPTQLLIKATTKTWFNPLKVYIIIGGLGGFGLELAYWMALRGAKELVLTSRTGIKKAYQKFIINKINFIENTNNNEYNKVEIRILTNNAITLEGANELIDEANSMGSVGGIFNLALVLRDGLIENQSVETFQEVCEPKLNLLSNLDVVTQEKCPQLDYFVCISSGTAGRGNVAQTNYGYANSAMERICELRRNKGLHGLAVQFGPIGDVGVVAEQLIDTVFKEEVLNFIGGVLSQRISSCIEILDRYLQINLPVLSSFKMKDIESVDQRKTEDKGLHQLCAHLNLDKRSDNETLGDIGLESLIAVEIQHRLERDYNISLSIVQIRKISVADFKEFRDISKDTLKQYSVDLNKTKANLSAIRWEVPSEPITFLNSDFFQTGKPVFLLPPVEGIFDRFKELSAKINRPVIGINWTKQLNDVKNFEKLCAYFKQIIINYSLKESSCDLIVHSFGAYIALNLLKHRTPFKSIIFLDSNDMFTTACKVDSKEKLSILFGTLRSCIPERILNKMFKEVEECKGEEQRIAKVIELIKEYGGKQLVGNDCEQIIRQSFERADIMIKYSNKRIDELLKYDNKNTTINQNFNENKTDITVIKLSRSGEHSGNMKETVQHVFGFNKEIFDGAITVHSITGTDAEFLTTNIQILADIINNKL